MISRHESWFERANALIVVKARSSYNHVAQVKSQAISHLQHKVVELASYKASKLI